MTLDDAFDPEAFRTLGHRMVDALADHLGDSQARAVPVLPAIDPDVLLSQWDRPFREQPASTESASDTLGELLQQLLRHSTRLHHPGYVGHQVSVPVPAAALFELTNALLNNGMAVYEMGQLQSVMERRVLDFLGATLGFNQEAGGVLTHGGSVGNFTALLAARQATAEHDVWTLGQRESLSVLVSDQAHYCIARSVQAMGWGSAGAWKVPTDGAFRMDTGALGDALAAARKAGRRVIAVVASACSTATGSFDNIAEIADFCAEHDLWLHVDGAHGASFALSQKHRARLAGVERADSVVWDLHKMMGMPALSTAVLFRQRRHAQESFAQEATYLFEDSDPEEQWFNMGRRSMECTKRAMGATAYCMLQAMGTAWFGQQIDTLMERTEQLAAMLREADDFELAHEPEANILCFRHLPPGEGRGLDQSQNLALDRHQEHLRQRVIDSGQYYIVQAGLRGSTWLRVTLMNPLTTSLDLKQLLASLRDVAAQEA